MGLNIKLLGDFEVTRDGQVLNFTGFAQSATILRILASKPGRLFSNEFLTKILWPKARKRKEDSIRRKISELRNIVQEPKGGPWKYVLSAPQGYRLKSDEDCQVDVEELCQFRDEAQNLQEQEDFDQALALCEKAFTLAKEEDVKEYLLEFTDFQELNDSREELQSLYVELLLCEAECHARQGHYRLAITPCRKALKLRHLEEKPYQMLMRCYARLDEKVEALNAYLEYVKNLQQVGREPSAEISKSHDQIQRDEILGDDIYPSRVLRPATQKIPSFLAPFTEPFVGRDTEYVQLLGRLRQAKNGKGCCVLIDGKPGVGKTRLIRELINYARRSRAYDFRGYCTQVASYDYQPWVTAISSGLKSRCIGSFHKVQRSYLIDVARHVPELRQWLREELSDVSMLSAVEVRQRSIGAFCQVFIEMSESKEIPKPIVLFLDDLHWADSASLTLFEHLLVQIEKKKLLILGAYRSDEIEKDHPLRRLIDVYGSKDLLYPISLDPLGVDNIKELIWELAKEQSLDIKNADELSQWIFEYTKGNPRWIRQLLSALLEESKIHADKRRWSIDLKELPNKKVAHLTGKNPFAWQVDRLKDAQRGLLELCSVLGTTFEFREMKDAWARDEDCTHILDDLINSGLLQVKGAEGFAFKDDALWDFVYRNISPPRKQELHEWVAKALERLYSDQIESQVVRLAYHAYHSRQWRKALGYSMRGINSKAEKHLWEECLKLAAFGLDSAQYLEATNEDHTYVDTSHFEILAKRNEIYELQGRRDLQAQDLGEMRELTDLLQDKSKLALTFKRRGVLYFQKRRHIEAIRTAGKALDLYREIGDRLGEASCLHNTGNAHLALGEYDKALNDYYFPALEIYRQNASIMGQREKKLILLTLLSIGVTLSRQQYPSHDYEKGMDFLRQALELSIETGETLEQARCLNNMGQNKEFQALYPEADAYYQQALKIRERGADKLGLAGTLQNMGNVYQAWRRFEEAVQYHRRALEIYTQTMDLANQAGCLDDMGNDCSAAGEYEAAVDYHQQALKIRKELSHSSVGMSKTLNNIGGVYLSLGEYERALDYSNRSLQIRRKGKDRAGEASSLTNIGNVFCGREKFTEALSSFLEALKISKEISDRRIQGMSLLGIGQVQNEQGNYPAALTSYTEAKVIFEEIKLDSERLMALAGEALAHVKLNNPEQADHSSEMAVQLIEQDQNSNICETPQEIYFTRYKVLSALGRENEARSNLEKANEQVMRFAKRIKNDELRKGFLNNVKTHREIKKALSPTDI